MGQCILNMQARTKVLQDPFFLKMSYMIIFISVYSFKFRNLAERASTHTMQDYSAFVEP